MRSRTTDGKPSLGGRGWFARCSVPSAASRTRPRRARGAARTSGPSTRTMPAWRSPGWRGQGRHAHPPASPFRKGAEAIAARLALVEEWKVLDEERALMESQDEVFVTEPRLERAGGNLVREPVPFLAPEAFGYPRTLPH